MDAIATWQNATVPIQPDRASALRSARLEALRRSGLFESSHYLQFSGAAAIGLDPLEDYHDRGWSLGYWPNPYFDPNWYCAQYPDVGSGGSDPLLHYVSYGEQEGRRPVPWFDPAWYRTRHQIEAQVHCLRHFLEHRHTGTVSPIPEFDSPWYCATYPDVAAAAMDPMEHYLLQGFREMRAPSPDFDTRFYRQRYLPERPDENPLLHYLRHRAEPGIHMRLPRNETTIPRELSRFAAPGPLFEKLRPLGTGTLSAAKVLAYYLPQYHAIPENDAWWGAGFTEWSNVARGLPRFAGHYQPRIPRDLGHYRLDDPEVMRRQIALAQGAGLGGFVFYFYWFDGKRLLENPLERFLADPSMDFPFCLMWANENWTRRWDGSEHDILIAQHYDRGDESALIACFARHFADPRYIRLQGRPLLMMYRPRLIPETSATVQRWREIFRRVHDEDPILVMAQSFNDADPREFGLDGATEFPPHKLVNDAEQINDRLDVLDSDFTAQVYNYDAIAACSEAMAPPPYPLIRAAIPGWDNDARRQGHGLVVHGATPDRYQAWLRRLIVDARARPFFGTPLVCINAWNEWAEGAYLEPDQHFGAAFLNATGRAIAGIGQGSENARLLLVGHDAFAAGAQMLLMHLGRHLRAVQGVCIEFLLCGGGELEPAYRDIAPVCLVADKAALNREVLRLHREGFRHALVNSAASAWCCPSLAAHGVAPTLLVHEMALLLMERHLVAPLNAAAASAACIVYPAEAVRNSVAPLLSSAPHLTAILPQGLYRVIDRSPRPAELLRRDLGVGRRDLLVAGLGYADLRKGLDLFLQVFRLASAHPAGANLHMAWAGAIDPALRTWLGPEIDAAERTGRFHLLGFRNDIGSLLTAADALLLTSREDPYPSAALETLSVGTKVIAFDGSGGIPDLLRRLKLGDVVRMADCAAMAEAALRSRPRRSLPAGSVDAFRAEHCFGTYVASLLRVIWPERPTVSVIVSCYRQEALLLRRLATIFGQGYPLHELVLRDDASDDDSVAVAGQVANVAGRSLTIVRAAQNSGSAFACWRDAVARATGDLVWIAEADDASEPAFLDRAVDALRDPAVLFAFTHSQPIDPQGMPRPEDYAASYAEAGGIGALMQDEVFDGRAFALRFLAERNILFNVSAVVWRRAALHNALETLGDDLLNWQVAGDWRLYLEVLTTAPGRVAYIARPLNLHCRHPEIVTARLRADRHLDEIRRMHRLIRERMGHQPGLTERQRKFLKQAAAWLRPTKPAIAQAAGGKTPHPRLPNPAKSAKPAAAYN